MRDRPICGKNVMYRVLVFPSCNEPGLEIVRALIKSNKVEVIGGSSFDTDFDPSRLILKTHLRCPRLGSPGFRDQFEQLLTANAIDTVFPATDSLVEEFSGWSVPGVTFVTTNHATATLLMSKSRVYAKMDGIVPVPVVYARDNAVLPVYAKPDCGAGSKGHRLVCDIKQLQSVLDEGLLLSEYLPGKEYTIDCISDLNGDLLFCAPRLRGQIGRGIALGTRPVLDADLQQHVHAIARTIRVEGPWFAQFKADGAGTLKLMEVNARVGGSMTLTRLAGVNIPLMALFLFKGFKVQVPEFFPNMILNRSLCNYVDGSPIDWVVWDWDDTLVRKDGKVDPDCIASLYDCHNRQIKQLLVTKNADITRQLALLSIPPFFTEVVYCQDKVSAVKDVLAKHEIRVELCVAVNDSNTERLALQQAIPHLRVVGPDALEVLGRERL